MDSALVHFPPMGVYETLFKAIIYLTNQKSCIMNTWKRLSHFSKQPVYSLIQKRPTLTFET